MVAALDAPVPGPLLVLLARLHRTEPGASAGAPRPDAPRPPPDDAR